LIKDRAAADDPEPILFPPHQLGTCPGTAAPPVVPIGTHSYVPKLGEARGGAGRFPSTRWKKRGIDL